jgi:hypothetical protein
VTNAEEKNRPILDEVGRSGKWFHAKKTVPIWAKPVEHARTVKTLEGEVQVSAGALLCRGAAAEIWPQSPTEVESRYIPTDEIDADGWRKYVPRPDAQGVMAAQVSHPFVVFAPWGKLSGKAGDFVVKNYGDRDVAYPYDVWIVDQTLFHRTYESVASER